MKIYVYLLCLAISACKSHWASQNSNLSSTITPDHDIFSKNPHNLAEEPLPYEEAATDLPAPKIDNKAHKDTMWVAEGFEVAGDGVIDPKRDTALYIHGWSQTGEAEQFLAANKWNKAGFNVVIFRWHRRSYDTGIIPAKAQSRLWQSVASELHTLFKKQLAPALGASYLKRGKEFRVIAHSLGSQLGSFLTASLRRERFPILVSRLELLDPYVQPEVLSPIPPAVQSFGKDRVRELIDVLLSDITQLSETTVVTGYFSFVGVLNYYFRFDRFWQENGNVDFLWPGGRQTYENRLKSERCLYRSVNSVAMGAGWLGNLLADTPGLLQKAGQLFTQQHAQIKQMYFNSIDPSFPVGKVDRGPINSIISARTPTATLSKLRFPIHYAQTGGIATATEGDDTFKKVKVCPSLKAGEIKIFEIEF